MNDENSKNSSITLQHNQELLAGKRAANHFVNQYAETSDHVPADRRREAKEAQREYVCTQGEPMMSTPFTAMELEDAMSMLQLKKAPGSDQITNEMLLHLGPKAKKKLLQLFNDS